jgi:hypothetical protein
MNNSAWKARRTLIVGSAAASACATSYNPSHELVLHVLLLLSGAGGAADL